MLLSNLTSKLLTCQYPSLLCLSSTPSYYFSRTTSSSTSSSSAKHKYQSKQDNFEQLKSQYAKDYFQNYRKQVQNDSVIRNFRRQIFQKNNTQINSLKQFDKKLDDQQKHLDKLLQSGSKNTINKYSKKIIQHIMNKKNMFKGKQNKDIFKDYADYSAYKTNYVTIQDRNYGDMDLLNRSNTQSRTYQFIQSLPDSYQQKHQVKRQMQILQPYQSQSLTISQYGKLQQQKTQNINRFQQTKSQLSHQNSFKITQQFQIQDVQPTIYDTIQQTLDQQTLTPFQLNTLSTQTMNKIYQLYIQGWSVRQISRRFGILPSRTKFHIWARARYYNQALPKYGLKFYLSTLYEQYQFMEMHKIMDYGLDLQQMTKTQRYQQITNWQQKRVDIQRTPQKYTRALQKIEKRQKSVQYDMVQIGINGVENKKYLLKQWKVYKGKRSDQYYLKNINKPLNKLMYQNRKIKSVYY